MSLDVTFNSHFDAKVVNPFDACIKLGGYFTFMAFNKDGSKAWREITKAIVAKNGVTTPALDDILNVYFGGGTQKALWYAGLIDNASFTALSAADTMASHAGWLENTGYSNSNRPTWGLGASSGNTVTNAVAMAFNINASVTIRGGFLVSNNTIGGTTGVLWATGAFASNQTLTNGQVLYVTYTLTSSGS
jgi:hypothetical protein